MDDADRANAALILAILQPLTPVQRANALLYVLSEVCAQCGKDQPESRRCQCANDT